MTGKMGKISHKITVQEIMGRDEIRFAIPVTNTSSIEQCYLIHLYDSHGDFIAKHPIAAEDYVSVITGADKVLPGKTEIMFIDSNWENWNVSHVAGQTIKFELRSDPTKIFGFCETGKIKSGQYKVVDTQNYSLSEYTDDKPVTEVISDIAERTENIIKIVTILIIVIIISKLVSEFT